MRTYQAGVLSQAQTGTYCDTPINSGLPSYNKGVHVMDRKLVRTVSTRQTEDDDPRQTTLTLDFANCSPEDVLEIAAQSAVIKWQGIARRAKGSIPSVATYVVPRPGTRSAQPIDHMAALAKVFGTERAKALAEKFGSAEQACKALEELLKQQEE